MRTFTFLLVALQAALGVTLRDGARTVTLDPATLSAEATLEAGRRVVLSDAALAGQRAGAVDQTPSQARWTLSPLNATVTASLTADGFRLTMQLAAAGTVTWPVLEARPGLEACTLPIAEGLYVPMGEPRWRTFLRERSPLHTMSELSMPFWGLHYGPLTVAYILENPFDNVLAWSDTLRLTLTHRVQRNQPTRAHAVLVRFGGGSPVEGARLFREWFRAHHPFRSFDEKVKALPDAAKLAGAAHIYLWAGASLAQTDVKDWPGLLKALLESRPGSPLHDAFQEIDASTRKQMRGERFVSAWLKRSILSAIDRTIRKLPTAFDAWLVPPAERGSAVSPRMIELLRNAGLDRLWLGLSDHEVELARKSPDTVRAAREAGYLIGPYDSYHSIHSPSEKDTWTTAQFDRQLYETGGIVREDGSKSPGFQGKGFHLSSLAAQPYIAKRIEPMLRDAPFNSWFVDCDATGELFDNYAPAFAHTQERDMQLRLERMQSLIDAQRLVVGSEGGAWFAAPVIHFAHGMMTPLFGFRDPLLHDPASKYFQGRWAPADEPAVFFKESELPDKFAALYFDPRYRLPLFQTVFHDAVITTNHWLAPTGKWPRLRATRELLEMLYGVPPLYHLNRESLPRLLPAIQAHYKTFSPLHREIAGLPMTAFEWLSADRLLQRTVFGGRVEVIANFGAEARVHGPDTIPPGKLLVRK